MSYNHHLSLSLDRQMKIIAGILRNYGLGGTKLTLVARHPTDAGLWVVKTDDDTAAVAAFLSEPAQPATDGAGGEGSA